MFEEGEVMCEFCDMENKPMESSNAPLREGAKVRKWSDNEWNEPTVDYLGIEP